MKKFLNTKGYTLAELIVVISILALMATSVFVGSNFTTQRREEFRKSVDEVVTLFKTARNLALTNETIDPGSGESSVPEGGFGVYVDADNNTFTLFADTHDSTGADIPNSQYDPDYDIKYFATPVLSLGNNGSVESISLDSSTVDPVSNPYKFLTVIFKPLDADVIINNNDSANSAREMEIIFSSLWEKRSLKLNKISRFFELNLIL